MDKNFKLAWKKSKSGRDFCPSVLIKIDLMILLFLFCCFFFVVVTCHRMMYISKCFLLSIYSTLKTNTTCIWYDLVDIKTGETNWCFHMLKSFMMIHGGLGFANSPWSWPYSKAGLGVWTVRQESCRCFFHTPQKLTAGSWK